MNKIGLLLSMVIVIAALSNNKSNGQTDQGGAPHRGKSSTYQPAPHPVEYRQTFSSAMLLGTQRRVPKDYTTIQEAINASVDGDTVLVSDGTYYENIRFMGKRILVASTFVTTNDTSHIANTIIDGSQPTHPDSASVVYFISGEDTNSVLYGFTIRGGRGTRTYPSWGQLTSGGGVYCASSGARLVRNFIIRNRITGANAWGGGVTSGERYLILEANRITDNFVHSSSGAGYGYSGGVDIENTWTRVVGNVFERDTVVGANFAVGGGMAYYELASNPQFGAYIQGNIFRANILQATSAGACAAGLDIECSGAVTIVDNLFEANAATSINGWAQGGGMLVDDQASTSGVRKMIVRNRFVNNVLSRGGSFTECGAGLMLYKAVATLDRNEIAGNSANGGGGGFYALESSFRLQNNLITRNASATYGGGLGIGGLPRIGTEQMLVNNTIFDNHAADGGGMMIGAANATVVNNIFWADSANSNSEIREFGASATVQYCDVQGGWPGSGNINADPLFVIPRSDSLNTNSPCISAGTLTNAPTTDHHGHLRPQPAGSRPDIGAEESPLARIQTISVSPEAINFGSIPVGRSSDTTTVTLKNISLQAVTIDSMRLHEPEFYMSGLPTFPATLLPSDSIRFRVFFRPSARGVTHGTIVVTNHDPLAIAANVALQGNGLLHGAQFQWFVDRVNAAPYPERNAIVDSFLAAHPVMPFIEQDSICQFMYFGAATSVNIPCDDNGWTTGAWPMARLSSTVLWYRAEVFPADLHMEYKFFLNGTTWIHDPRNPRIIGQYGNSELWMPAYTRPPELLYYPDIPHGTLQDTVFYSTNLGNSRSVSVYLPPAYNPAESCAVVLYHDGLDYLSNGFAKNVLDYLLSVNRIQRAIGVFVPPVNRNPEYVGGQQDQFAAFIASELMPYIDARYSTQRRPASRAMLGLSNGGNIALWIAYNYPHVFGNAASFSGNIQSTTSSAFQNDSLLALKLYVDVGMRDMAGFLELSRGFRDIIQARGYDYRYNEWAYGYHSMSVFSEHQRNALEFFIPGSAMSVEESEGTPALFSLQQNYPNPFNPTTEIRYQVSVVSHVTLMVYDVLGREVATLVNELKQPGDYNVQFDASRLASGVYFYRMQAGSFVDVKKLLLLK